MRTRAAEGVEVVQVQEIDLRGICRDSAKQGCTVAILDDNFEFRPWLYLGMAELDKVDSDRRLGDRWMLKARLGAESARRGDPTDFEHDGAYACCLPLVSAVLHRIGHGATTVAAYIDSERSPRFMAQNFRVPTSADYDPRKHPDARDCEIKDCHDKKHVIVPEGFYMPPYDASLHELVRGRRVQIQFFSTLGR
jgi:hypothetical protein